MKEGTRRRIAPIFLFSIAIHIAAGLVAGVIVVVRRLVPVEKFQVAAKTVSIPAPDRTAAAAASGNEGVGGSGSPQCEVAASAIRDLALENISPRKAATQSVTPTTSSLVTGYLQSTGVATGIEFGLGSSGSSVGGGGKAEQAPASFLGVKAPGERIVLMFDISKTVSNAAAKAGMPMERIREETIRLVDNLDVNARFNIVQFARNYVLFQPRLVASSRSNKDAARQWLNRFFGTQGTLPPGIPSTVTGSPGFLVALSEVFKLDPDCVIVITDCDMQRGTSVNARIPLEEVEKAIADLQSKRPRAARIQFIGVGAKDAAANRLRQILACHGGGGSYTALKN
jgi:hypothetical protein